MLTHSVRGFSHILSARESNHATRQHTHCTDQDNWSLTQSYLGKMRSRASSAEVKCIGSRLRLMQILANRCQVNHYLTSIQRENVESTPTRFHSDVVCLLFCSYMSPLHSVIFPTKFALMLPSQSANISYKHF